MKRELPLDFLNQRISSVKWYIITIDVERIMVLVDSTLIILLLWILSYPCSLTAPGVPMADRYSPVCTTQDADVTSKMLAPQQYCATTET